MYERRGVSISCSGKHAGFNLRLGSTMSPSIALMLQIAPQTVSVISHLKPVADYSAPCVQEGWHDIHTDRDAAAKSCMQNG